MTTVTERRPREPWPVWAKVLIVLVSLLVIVTLSPWLFMTYAMATTCTPMMGQIFEIMRGGMMR